MNAISAMTFDFTSITGQGAPVATGKTSTFDVAHFDQFYRQQAAAQAAAPSATAAVDQAGGFQAAVRALESLNMGATDIGQNALNMAADAKDLTPGDMLHLTMQAHHFLFQSQLTANIANRTSEGIQQLFRQQS